jgi:hypothetical protein
VVKGNVDLGPSKLLEGGGTNHHDLLGYEFLLPPGLIRVGATKYIVDLLVSLGEVTLGILGLLLLISRLGHLENLICKTLESVIVSCLVLSLGVENANAIQKAFKFTRPGPVLLMMTRSFYRIDKMVRLSLLVMALGRPRLIQVARLLLLSCVEDHLLGQGVSVGNGKHLL